MSSKFSHLSQEQRYKIEALKVAGFNQSYIAKQLGVSKSTISRELRRNSVANIHSPEKYKADKAHFFADHRLRQKKHCSKMNDSAIIRRIMFLLKKDWSPEQIAQTCDHRNIPMLSCEAIYQWIYSQNRKIYDWTNHLRRHRRKRRKRKLDKQSRTIIKNKVSIHKRPDEVNNQERFGDFETDLVKCTNGYLVTITERKALFNFIIKIPNKEAETVRNAIIETLLPYKYIVKTITSDNGTEFARHQDVAKTLQIDWFFADPYSSQQRGCNENQNGLIRQYFKRKTNLDDYSQQDILLVANKLNNRPRKKNDFLSPIKLLHLHHVAFVA